MRTMCVYLPIFTRLLFATALKLFLGEEGYNNLPGEQAHDFPNLILNNEVEAHPLILKYSCSGLSKCSVWDFTANTSPKLDLA